jgi:hypothetical protein
MPAPCWQSLYERQDGVNVDFAGAKIDRTPRRLLWHCRNLKCERYKITVIRFNRENY